MWKFKYWWWKRKIYILLENKFNEINESSTFITGQIKSEIYIKKSNTRVINIYIVYVVFVHITFMVFHKKYLCRILKSCFNINFDIFYIFTV